MMILDNWMLKAALKIFGVRSHITIDNYTDELDDTSIDQIEEKANIIAHYAPDVDALGKTVLQLKEANKIVTENQELKKQIAALDALVEAVEEIITHAKPMPGYGGSSPAYFRFFVRQHRIDNLKTKLADYRAGKKE